MKKKERTCIYTDEPSKCKDCVIPRKFLDEDDYLNWANTAPSNQDYKNLKEDRMPTELELEANEVFYKLELYRLRVKFYGHKLAEIQAKLKTQHIITIDKKETDKKEKKHKKKEVEQSYEEKAKIECVEEIIEQKLKERSEFWK